MFFDQAKIYVKAGDGGNGVVAFRREKFVPRGGPNGGNGGRGGHVYLVVDPAMNTLLSYTRQVHHRAERGGHGGGSNKTGANGADLYLSVPPGTVVRDGESGEVLADLAYGEQQVLVARGGRGGRGNAAFKSDRNNAPRLAENGERGEERWLSLELKLIGDVGIVGIPNAGKSTLLSVVSAAKPEIAAYPFTTVVPNLGVAEVDHRQIVMVDIPGLLEGAHEGVGLGLDFLRHVERTRILIHLLDGVSQDPLGDFEAIMLELTLFNPQLAEKPQIVVLNKMDLPQAREQWPQVRQAMGQRELPAMAISAVSGENVQELLFAVDQMLADLPVDEPEGDVEMVEITPQVDENAFQIRREGQDLWIVEGVAIERAVQMTNWNYYEAALRFQRILQAMGIQGALEDRGVQEGDTVQIGDHELIWGYENAYEE